MKTDTRNISCVNLAAVRLTTVDEAKLPFIIAYYFCLELVLCLMFRCGRLDIVQWFVMLVSQDELPALAKRNEHFALKVTVYGRKRKRFPTQVQEWEFKMEVTPSVRTYIGIL